MSAADRDPWWQRAALPVAVALATAACFAGALHNDFVAFDDDTMLLRNPSFRGLGLAQLRWMLGATVGGHWHPLTWVSFAIDHALWGMDPRGYHLTNLLLHATTAALVAVTLPQLLAPALPATPAAHLRIAGAVAALVWAVHPLRVESVAWATERRDVLSGVFWVLAVLAYVRAHEPGLDAAVRRRRLAGALGALALSLLSKAWGMTFFAVLLVLDVWPLRRWRAGERTRVLAEKAPFALLGIGTAALVWRAVHAYLPDLGEHHTGERIGQAAYGLWFYLARSVWPGDLVPMVELRGRIDPLAWPFAGALAAVTGTSLVLLAARHRWPSGLAAWIAYGVILSPVLGITQAGPQLVADRYAYLATLPLAAVLAGGFCALLALRAPLARRLAGGAVALWVAFLATSTVRQVDVWRDTVTLWTHAVAVDPGNAMARFSLGAAFDDAGRPEEARAQWDALAAIVAAHPGDVPARARLGLAEGRLAMAAKHAGRLDEARERLERAIALTPADGRLRINLGGVLLDMGRPADAVAQWEAGLALTEDTAVIRNELGLALLGAGAWPEAESMLSAARRLAPEEPMVAVNLGLALWQLGRTTDAVAAWKDALALDPTNDDAKNLLARAQAHGAGG